VFAGAEAVTNPNKSSPRGTSIPFVNESLTVTNRKLPNNQLHARGSCSRVILFPLSVPLFSLFFSERRRELEEENRRAEKMSLRKVDRKKKKRLKRTLLIVAVKRLQRRMGSLSNCVFFETEISSYQSFELGNLGTG